MEEREYLIALNAITGVSASQKMQIIKEFGSAKAVFRSPKELALWSGCRPSCSRDC